MLTRAGAGFSLIGLAMLCGTLVSGCVTEPVGGSQGSPLPPVAESSTSIPTPPPALIATPAPTAAGAPTLPVVGWAPQARTKTAGCASQGGLPDPACNPGAVDPRVNQADIASTICMRGYTATVRPAVSVTDRIKRDQMAAYGLQGQRLGDYELDHLISLELGGAPADVANLWPEPWNGDTNAHQKDAVENYLHEQVCRGNMQLADAQRMIATDWRGVYATRKLQPAVATPAD